VRNKLQQRGKSLVNSKTMVKKLTLMDRQEEFDDDEEEEDSFEQDVEEDLMDEDSRDGKGVVNESYFKKSKS